MLIKKLIYIIIITLAALIYVGCNESNDLDKANIANSLFLRGSAADSAKTVFYTDNININGNIYYYNKNDHSVYDTNISGYDLTVYGNYLFYMYKYSSSGINPDVPANRYTLYRVPLSNPSIDFAEDVITFDSPTKYFIDNDRVYYECYYQLIKSTDLYGNNEKLWDGLIYLGASSGISFSAYTEASGIYEITTQHNKKIMTIKYSQPIEYRFNDFAYIYSTEIYYLKDACLFKYDISNNSDILVINRLNPYTNWAESSILGITASGIYYYDGITIYRLTYSGEVIECETDYSDQTIFYISNNDGELYCLIDNQCLKVE